MRTKAHSQNRFVRIITLPIRALGKARDFYVRSLTGCADRVGHAGITGLPSGQFSSLPRSYSSSSSRSNESEDMRELVRAASARTAGTRVDPNMLMMQQQYHHQKKQKQQTETVPRSCSVGMGRIDEDKPLEFDEEEQDSVVDVRRKDLLYPRSRSHAVVVTRRSVMF